MAQKDPNISRIRDEAAPRPAGAMLPQGEWRGRDGNDPSVDIAKDADQRF